MKRYLKINMGHWKKFFAVIMCTAGISLLPGISLAAGDDLQAVDEIIVTGGAVKEPANAGWAKVNETKPAELPMIVDANFDNSQEQSK